ncbi:E2 protein [Puma concolor papillomavirus 1]|uniref:Regulatory protein E2 n=1 Tax=Puma concolor papillomavirus 1 TaxID=2773289 RepID=I6LEJ2_9PAPI|nr:E2 protein [Puma concolor papillomavirus 1]
MENISLALESVQEQLLTLYETDSPDLRDQIKHWKLIRREQVLYYCARRRGITRVGMAVVPPLAAAQQRAKAAIEQELLLQSLLESDFAGEPWTLSDTSRERLLTEPAYCFKKDGEQIEVRYDNDRENMSSHVLWTAIYYQSDDDKWRKTQGRVDARGLFYVDNCGVKTYYVDFEQEAKKYGKTGEYEIVNKLTTPILTSTTPAGLGHSSSSGAATRGGTPKKQTPTKKRKRPLRISSPRTPRPGGFRRGGRQGLASSTPKPTSSSPEEAGRPAAGLPRRSGAGPEGSLQQDPPVLVLAGDANSLKCVRFRLKGKHSSLFCRVSTTWTWTAPYGTDRWGRSRMLLTFRDNNQREIFEKTVRLPQSVQSFRGSFEAY